jgi:hypothetical protein
MSTCRRTYACLAHIHSPAGCEGRHVNNVMSIKRPLAAEAPLTCPLTPC